MPAPGDHQFVILDPHYSVIPTSPLLAIIPGLTRDPIPRKPWIPDRQAANSRTDSKPPQQKPNLRLHGKSPPNGLNVSCKNSVGKALEIERDLAATDNPRESAWRDSYCKQRCEAIEERCPVADDYFYYRFRNMCGNSEYWDCWHRGDS